jgi:YidC/Oxa1 family membrane protein insertase
MFTTYVIQPIYNLFIFLTGVMPGGDAGLAIIALTVGVRLVLYPIFAASIRTQMGMQAMQAELEEAKRRLKGKEELNKFQLELIRKHRVNPLSMLGAVAIQFGVIIALYYALFREGFPKVNEALLYPSVHAPATVSTNFFGLLDLLTPHHLVLALLVGASQWWAIHLTLRRTPAPSGASADTLAAHRMQQRLMRSMMPALLAVLGFVFQAGVGLYFVTSNLLSVVQELLIRRQLGDRV